MAVGSERMIGRRGRWRLASAVDFACSLAVTVNLMGVMMLDGVDEFVEQIDALRGRLVGEPRQSEGQDDGDALHWSSSRAHWMCSVLICRTLASAAAESA